ncbi:MAG: HU family DNA-binding protein [Candidatus Aminicenantaceae bacterium]
MTKKEITIKMSKDAGITAKQAEKALSALLEEIKESLKRKNRVTFSGFGSFEVRETKARKGKNPRTRETIDIPKKKRIKFNPSKQLKKNI